MDAEYEIVDKNPVRRSLQEASPSVERNPPRAAQLDKLKQARWRALTSLSVKTLPPTMVIQYAGLPNFLRGSH
jgi:hypothetical protein